jgi:hypothetical protein
MSLVTKLKPHLEELKVHKQPTKQTSTERRLTQMTMIITNPRWTREQKDKMLREIVAESQVEKALKDKGIKV